MSYTLDPAVGELSDADLSELAGVVQQETARRQTVSVSAQQVTQVATALLAAGGDLSTLTAAITAVQATGDGSAA